MLLSVVVPVYNVEKYLRQCLNSLLSQTLTGFEVIMIDDGSSDTSGDICEEYASLYSNFRVIHKKNEGLGLARNTGLEYVNTDYVMFLDSDDYLDFDCIETLYKNLKDNAVDLCKGGFKRVNDDGEVINRIDYNYQVFSGNYAKSHFLPRLIGSSPSYHDSFEMSVCGSIYNMSPIRNNNLKFQSEKEYISEDLVFNIDYLQHANGACVINSLGYNYRLNMHSLTTSYREDRFDACKKFYLYMHEKLEQLHYSQSTFLRLDKMFFIYLKMCISQEKSKISSSSKKDRLKNISSICRDSLVQNIISNYPIEKLGFKQAIFLKLVSYNLNRFLLFFAERGIF